MIAPSPHYRAMRRGEELSERGLMAADELPKGFALWLATILVIGFAVGLVIG